MGNEESIYKIIVINFLYEKGYLKEKPKTYYYIEKTWYAQFCEYVRITTIEENITKMISTKKYENLSVYFKKPKDFSFDQNKKPPSEFNLYNYRINLPNIENNKRNEILDVSKYIKINQYFHNELNKQYKCKNKIKYDSCNFRLIIYNEERGSVDEKYIEKEKEESEKKLKEIYKDKNPIIIFSNQKKEIEHYKKEYSNEVLNKKLENLENNEFYLIILQSKENIKTRKLFGRMGLPNTGNNCYMNCCIQCLSNVFPLTKYFLFDKYIKDINESNQLGSEGKIVVCYANLIKMLWNQKLDLTTIDHKKCYYYDPTEDYEKRNIFINLKNEIGKNNVLYNNYDQRDACEFLFYFIDILHEDLNRVKIINNYNNEVNFYNYKNIKELYDIKFVQFKNINNSIIIDIFYGMSLTTTTCVTCETQYPIFEPYNILSLPLNPNSISDSNADKLLNKTNENDKKNIINKIPGKNNFYFCKCVIIPYNCKSEKKIIIYPINKKDYDNCKIYHIYVIIMHLLGLNQNDLIPTIISNNNTYYQYICSGNEYLYEAFKKPNDLKIYFVQTNMKKKELNIFTRFKDEKELLAFFLNPGKINFNPIPQNNKFNLGEDEMGSYMSLESNLVNPINFNFLKLISIIKSKEDNQFHIINLPKIINHSLKDNTRILYTQIKNSFQIGKENFNELTNNKKLNAIVENLDTYISSFENTNFPFILFFKIEKNIQNLTTKKNQDFFYIPIPFCDISLQNFADNIKGYISKKNKYKGYVLKDYRTYIIWLKYEEYIKNIEYSFKLDGVIEINPYEKIYEEIQLNKNGKNNKHNNLNEKEITLDEILKIYCQKEKNTYFCEKCNKNVTAVKQTYLYSLPEVIIFHLQRKVNGIYNKVKISFPFENLNLSPFQYINDETKTYDLIGIINFIGDMNKGHYNCFCKNDITKEWYLFNDVCCFPIEDISKEINHENVYALIYKNRNFKEYIYQEENEFNFNN